MKFLSLSLFLIFAGFTNARHLSDRTQYELKSSSSTNKNLKSCEYKLEIKGTLYFTSFYQGGIERDDSHLTLLPLQKFKLYVVRFISNDSIPKIIKSFTTNNDGTFSISLPPGKYGFVTDADTASSLSEGQCLPKNVETNSSNVIVSSTWECNMTCPIELSTASINNLVITNHRSSFCMNCQ